MSLNHMPTIDSLQERDLRHNWHPASQMKNYERFKPFVVKRAEASYIELEDGRKLFDGISSWWCKSLGHGHPRLKAALTAQMERFEHVIFAGTTHETIVRFAEQLAHLLPPLNKVFYASDGASAVEIALKMSLHSRLIEGNNQRTKFIALQNSYHGETIGTCSVSDIGRYREPYETLLFQTPLIENIPYVSSTQDPLWNDCSSMWPAIEKSLAPYTKTATAVIVEPIVQGAGGMKIYSQDFLRRLRTWTAKHGIHLIADEIMTGIGRTQKMLACQHAEIVPDFLCLSKGLTSGWLPLSVTLIHDDIYKLFYDLPSAGKNFLHSHTFSGNALAVAVASAVLSIFEEEKICTHVSHLEPLLLSGMQAVAKETGALENVRGIGGIAAADFKNFIPYSGQRFTEIAAKHGLLLRPIGQSLYWLPPLNMDLGCMDLLKQGTVRAVEEFVK